MGSIQKAWGMTAVAVVGGVVGKQMTGGLGLMKRHKHRQEGPCWTAAVGMGPSSILESFLGEQHRRRQQRIHTCDSSRHRQTQQSLVVVVVHKQQRHCKLRKPTVEQLVEGFAVLQVWWGA